MGRALLALLVGGLVASGCGDTEATARPTGQIEICGAITDELGCRGPSQTVSPGLPYVFVARGPDLPGGRLSISLLRAGGAGDRLVFTMYDYVGAGDNTYVNNFRIEEPGRYRLELRAPDGMVWAERTVEATEVTAHREEAERPSFEELSSDPTAHQIRIACAETCEALETALGTLRTVCTEDPMSEVRRAVPESLVAAGCCGWAVGAYENACPPGPELRACLDRWQEACAATPAD